MKAIAAILSICGILSAFESNSEAVFWSSYRHDYAHSATSDTPVDPPLEALWPKALGSDISFEIVDFNGKIFVGSSNILYCYNRETATEEWRYTCPGEITTTACVFAKYVVVGCKDGTVLAIDTEFAKPRWQIKPGIVTKGFTQKDNLCYFGTDRGELFCLNSETGKEVYKINLSNRISTPPVIEGDKIFAACDNGNLYSLDLATGNVVWKNDKLVTDVVGGLTASKGVLYLGSHNNSVYAVSQSDGSPIWSKRVDGWIGSPPLIVGEEVFFKSKQTTLWCFDKSNGNTNWHFGLQPTRSEPILSGDVIYVGSNRQILAISVTKRSEIWMYEFKEEQPTTFALSNGRMMVGTSLGRIHCFKPGPAMQAVPESVSKKVYKTDMKPGFDVEITNARTDKWNTMLKGDLTTTNSWLEISEPIFELESGKSVKIHVKVISDRFNKLGMHNGELVATAGSNQIKIPVQIDYIDPFPPEICMDSESLDFGAVSSGSFKKIKFNMENCGKGKLVFEINTNSEGDWLKADIAYGENYPSDVEVIGIVADATKLKVSPGEDCIKLGTVEIKNNTANPQITIPVTMRIYGIPLPTIVKLTIGSSAVFVNNQQLTFMPPPYIAKGRTMVPLRLIGEAFFAKVFWNPDDKSIKITDCTNQVRFRVGSKKVEIIKIGEVQEREIDVPPEIQSGRTFIPLRAVSDILGAKTDWDPTTKTVTLTYKP